MAHSILILDDDFHVRESLALELEDENFIVHQAARAKEAFDILDKEHIDLAIVDLRLPGMSGIEFLKVLQQERPKLEYVVYTGSPMYRESLEADSLPEKQDRVFIKPQPSLEVMIARIRSILQDTRQGAQERS